MAEKILSIITFGFFGTPATKAKPASGDSDKRTKPEPARRPERSESPKANEPTDDKQAKKARETRSASPDDVTSERLYVGNLDYDASESDLYDLFNGVGSVRDAEVVCHKYTQRSKGYAFVEMATIEEAKRAVEVLNNQDFMGRVLWVSGAKSSGPKGGSNADQEQEEEETENSSEREEASAA